MAPTSPGAGRGVLRAVALLLTVCLAGAVTTFAAAKSNTTTTAHRVVVGDTLWSLAQSSGTTVARLQALNGLTSETIQLGTVLQLPAAAVPVVSSTSSGSTGTSSGGQTSLGTSGAATYSSSSVIHSRSLLTTYTLPTRTTAESYIRAEALRQGVPVSLALAVAYQESGFSQWMVSPTDAVGIMQLEPGTADWVGTYLVGRTLDRYNGYDNVVGGVALLKSLLAATSTPNAIAAYYQGLKAVQQHGMFTDTQAYVASVLALQPRFG